MRACLPVAAAAASLAVSGTPATQSLAVLANDVVSSAAATTTIVLAQPATYVRQTVSQGLLLLSAQRLPPASLMGQVGIRAGLGLLAKTSAGWLVGWPVTP